MILTIIENFHHLALLNNPFRDDDDIEFVYDKDKSFISLVAVDLTDYIGLEKPVKKTLTIPLWADKKGRELGLNFSQKLTEAILEKNIGQ
ncbi:hypothetical protein [Peribacillus simplex]|uniref:hypothetical protein n=1 Tax=Peribacillus simplex TaxID=1478 RepID=UPI003D26C723